MTSEAPPTHPRPSLSSSSSLSSPPNPPDWNRHDSPPEVPLDRIFAPASNPARQQIYRDTVDHSIILNMHRSEFSPRPRAIQFKVQYDYPGIGHRMSDQISPQSRQKQQHMDRGHRPVEWEVTVDEVGMEDADDLALTSLIPESAPDDKSSSKSGHAVVIQPPESKATSTPSSFSKAKNRDLTAMGRRTLRIHLGPPRSSRFVTQDLKSLAEHPTAALDRRQFKAAYVFSPKKGQSLIREAFKEPDWTLQLLVNVDDVLEGDTYRFQLWVTGSIPFLPGPCDRSPSRAQSFSQRRLLTLRQDRTTCDVQITISHSPKLFKRLSSVFIASEDDFDRDQVQEQEQGKKEIRRPSRSSPKKRNRPLKPLIRRQLRQDKDDMVRVYWAHKSILLEIPYFERMLNSPFAESHFNQSGIYQVTLNGHFFPSFIMDYLLDYFYTGDMALSANAFKRSDLEEAEYQARKSRKIVGRTEEMLGMLKKLDEKMRRPKGRGKERPSVVQVEAMLQAHERAAAKVSAAAATTPAKSGDQETGQAEASTLDTDKVAQIQRMIQERIKAVEDCVEKKEKARSYDEWQLFGADGWIAVAMAAHLLEDTALYYHAQRCFLSELRTIPADNRVPIPHPANLDWEDDSSESSSDEDDHNDITSNDDDDNGNSGGAAGGGRFGTREPQDGRPDSGCQHDSGGRDQGQGGCGGPAEEGLPPNQTSTTTPIPPSAPRLWSQVDQSSDLPSLHKRQRPLQSLRDQQHRHPPQSDRYHIPLLSRCIDWSTLHPPIQGVIMKHILDRQHDFFGDPVRNQLRELLEVEFPYKTHADFLATLTSRMASPYNPISGADENRSGSIGYEGPEMDHGEEGEDGGDGFATNRHQHQEHGVSAADSNG